MRGVHQTAQTVLKLFAKKYNHTTSQVIVHCTASHGVLQFAVL